MMTETQLIQEALREYIDAREPLETYLRERYGNRDETFISIKRISVSARINRAKRILSDGIISVTLQESES